MEVKTLEDYIEKRHVRYMSDNLKKELEEKAKGCVNGVPAEHMFWVLNKITEYPKCEGCNVSLSSKNWKPFLKPEQRTNLDKSQGYMKYCGQACAYKYGSKQENYKKSCIEKYGVDHPMKDFDILAKRKATNIDRYGDENPNRWTGEKFLALMEEKHGTRTVRHIDGVHDKIKETNSEKTKDLVLMKIKELELLFDAKCLTKLPDKINRVDDVLFDWKHSCGREWSSYISFRGIRSCPACSSGTSKGEQEIAQFVSDLGIKIEQRTKSIISPRELDIFIPDRNLAIEFDGTYWHNAKFEDRNKCLTKLDMCNEKQINLLTIQEHLWVNKPDLVKSRLKSILGFSDKIAARKTNIKNVDLLEAQKFLKENHLQGYARSSIRLGLYYEEELVMLVTFAKPRWAKKHDWELIRMASKASITIQGGASKLIQHFRKNNEGSIISYADRCWSQGNVYKQINFEFSHATSPSYWWIHHSLGSYARYQTQKSKLPRLLADINKEFFPELSEEDNMRMAGFLPLFDRGNLVFVMP